MSEKWKVFEKELNYIKCERIRNFTTEVLKRLPDYFYEVSSSSTNKYHPKFALGEGGLTRHSKVAAIIMVDLFNQEMFSSFSSLEKDIAISAILPHDGLKHGKTHEQWVRADHPLLMADFILNDAEVNTLIDNEVLHKIADCIRTHMGMYNTDFKTKQEILPKPKTKLQNLVHLCDYLASRKYFEEFNFDVDVVRK